MVISPFVLLVCSLAVDGLSRKIPPQARMCIPNFFTTNVPFRGSDEVKSDAVLTLCGHKQNHCATFGHTETCCPPDTTCRGSSQTSSHVFCCPNAFSCSENMDQRPMHMLECPASVGGGCCATVLRCASDLCFEYHYKTSAVFQPFPIHNSTSPDSQGFYDGVSLATVGTLQKSFPPSSLSDDRTVPTYALQNCQPEDIGQKGQDLPISDKILGIPTAWRAKISEIAMKSQAEENWDGKSGKRRLRRLGCVVMGLSVITVVMFVF